MKRPDAISGRNAWACSSMSRKSVSLNDLSIIRLARCGLEQSSSQFHHCGQFCCDATTPVTSSEESASNVFMSGYTQQRAPRQGILNRIAVRMGEVG